MIALLQISLRLWYR